MPRKAKSNMSDGGYTGFRFVWVTWDPKQLVELRGWMDGNETSVVDGIQHLSDASWKLSISENQRSGRYLVSLTDKGGRPGCSKVSFGIEHSDLKAAILGAVYYGVEIIAAGIPEIDNGGVVDLW